MGKHYRAGIIGLGFIGGADQASGDALGQQVTNLDGTHFFAINNHSRIDLAAGSSRDEGRRQRFASRTDAKIYSDWREMIEKEELDIVSVATYAPVHSEITVGCAEAGIKAIYCEKPIATQLEDAQRMVAACDKAGSLLVINHNLRFNPNCRRLRDYITGGGLGDLTSATLQWSAGRLGNVGTHQFDAIQMLTGRKVEAVSGMLDLSGKLDCRGPQFKDPGGWGMLRLEGGLIVTVDAADYAGVPATIIINGTKGRVITQRDEMKFEYWDGETDYWAPPGREKSSMDRAVEEIVEWLDGAEFPYQVEEAVRTLEAIVAFHASHNHNATWAELPLEGSDRKIEVLSG